MSCSWEHHFPQIRFTSASDRGLHPQPAVLDISRAYGISTNHLSKVARLLVQNGFVKAIRGRNGGLQLAKTPEEINCCPPHRVS